ncbi:MAG: selenide, water dikinase SelD [Spirochaetes bacterium RBG_16_49_21]|nr:MAG: selenide, water dikinase SelD [Spirochaetes bacterium RBG_16_49_21]
MKGIAVPYDGNVLVGMDTSDDAGVYRISESAALVQTVDFITPIVDDPFTFGRIAACNSLSDVYAMGGRPLTALNVVCFPTGKFTLDILRDILTGGLAMLAEAGVQLLGGHSVNDPEMKYGLSVTGIIHPDRVVRNDTIREGDVILLTKPLGTGVIATALKAGGVDEGVVSSFVVSMTALNRQVSEIMLRHNPHACTDVTGFGLAGHLREMLGKNSMEITIDSASVPLLPGALEAAANGLMPAGLYKNRDFVGGLCSVSASVRLEISDLLFDPQTSGGLLIAMREDDAERFCAEAHDKGIKAASIIGRVKKSSFPGITIV